MERSCLQRIIRLADYLTAIELLHLRIKVESTALEQQHLESRISELARDGDACRAGAHNAEIALEDCPVVERSRVGVQLLNATYERARTMRPVSLLSPRVSSHRRARCDLLRSRREPDHRPICPAVEFADLAHW